LLEGKFVSEFEDFFFAFERWLDFETCIFLFEVIVSFILEVQGVVVIKRFGISTRLLFIFGVT